jgi:hypothetical protein
MSFFEKKISLLKSKNGPIGGWLKCGRMNLLQRHLKSMNDKTALGLVCFVGFHWKMLPTLDSG